MYGDMGMIHMVKDGVYRQVNAHKKLNLSVLLKEEVFTASSETISFSRMISP
jgi:hypothetical protein